MKKNKDHNPIWTIILIGTTLVSTTFAYVIWGEKIFENTVFGLLFILILLSLLTKGGRILISYSIYLIVFGSGWIILINKLIEKVIHDNSLGLVTWPAIGFFVALFLGILPGIGSKKLWLSPLGLMSITFIYSMFYEMNVWLNSVAVAVVVMTVSLLSRGRVAKAEQKALKNSALNALLLGASIGVTGLILISTPVVVGAVLGTWGEIFTMIGGVMSGTWMTWIIINLIDDKRRRKMKKD